MKFKILLVFTLLLLFIQNSNSEDDPGYLELPKLDDIFYIGKMDSYNNDFVLFFKTREKAILARGEEFNYITDYPQDLYIYNRKTKTTEPLITYEWFRRIAEFFYAKPKVEFLLDIDYVLYMYTHLYNILLV